MKARNRIALVLFASLAGSAWWLSRPAATHSAPVSAEGVPATSVQGLDPRRTVVVSPKEIASAEDERSRVRRLVAEMQAIMRRAEGLSAEDAKQFETLAGLTNEFENGLDAERAALLVRHMPAGFLSTVWGDLALRRWAREQRAAAAAWMAAHPDPSQLAATALMHGWFDADPQAAKDYLALLPEGMWRTHAATAAAEEALVAGKPSETLALLQFSSADNPRLSELEEWSALAWGRTDFGAALAWAAKAESTEQRDRLLAAAHVGYANVDPAGAATALLRSVSSPEAAWEGAASIVRIWAATDAAAAARWVETFPAGAGRTRALTQLLEVWAHADERSTRRWVATLPDEADRLAASRVLEAITAERGPAPGGG